MIENIGVHAGRVNENYTLRRSTKMRVQASNQLLLVFCLVSGQIILASGQAGDEGVGEGEGVADVFADQGNPASDLNDYKEEKNHSEAIQRILRDFEKTLVENKIMLDTSSEEEEEVIVDPLNMNSTSIESNDSISSNRSIESPGLEIVGVGGNLTAENASAEVARVRMVCNNTLPDSGLRSEVLVHNGSSYQAAILSEHQASATNRSSPAPCSLTLFFADWCHFSAAAAPHFNALARAFPQLPAHAVDSSKHHSLNTQYGVMAVPTILVFHNSKPLYKYNLTEYSLDKFIEFVSLVTGLEAINGTSVESEDYEGPVPSVAVEHRNFYLWLALTFSILCGIFQFSKSPLARQLRAQVLLSFIKSEIIAHIHQVATAWREAEIQHEHHD